MCSKEELPSMYHIVRIRPEVEVFEVTPELSPEIFTAYPTANQAEEQEPKVKFGARFKGKYPAFVEIMDTKQK